MERLEGETLASKLMRGAFELPALLDIGIPLADALEAAAGRPFVCSRGGNLDHHPCED
jgi:hypothetical protein